MNIFQSPTLAASKQTQFITGVRAICTDKIRAFWMPDVATGTGTTIPDLAVAGRTWTYDSSPSGGRYSALGNGQQISFNGTTQYLTTPDAADLSFGNSTVDSPFSVFAVLNQTGLNNGNIITKTNALNVSEWAFTLSAGSLRLFVFDASTAALGPFVTSSATLSTGAAISVAGVYGAAVGGALAATDMALYASGLPIANGVTQQGAYVAMENQTQVVTIGANAAGATPFTGSLACVIVTAQALTAPQVAQLHALAQRYFGI